MTEEKLARTHAMLWAAKVSVSYEELCSMPESYYFALLDEYNMFIDEMEKEYRKLKANRGN